MKLEFTEADEDVLHRSGRVRGISVEKANARLAEMLRECPEIYTGPGLRNEQFWDTVLTDGYTHRARLVCIEEIK